jgi:hypothetical protein
LARFRAETQATNAASVAGVELLAVAAAQDRVDSLRLLAKSVVLARDSSKETETPSPGIIRYLSRAHCGGQNVVDGGVVAITMSSINGNRLSRNAAEFSLTFPVDACTNDSHGEWIKWDFGERRIFVTQYSIMSFQRGAGIHHLKSWKLEGSSDGQNWKIVDEERDRPELNGPCNIGTFKAQTSFLCRYCRLVSTGPNHAGSHHIVIAGLELYGLLTESP